MQKRKATQDSKVLGTVSIPPSNVRGNVRFLSHRVFLLSMFLPCGLLIRNLEIMSAI